MPPELDPSSHRSAAYVAMSGGNETTEMLDRDNLVVAKPTEAMTGAETSSTSIAVSQPNAGATVGARSGEGVDWRERALSFLGSVDGESDIVS